VNVTGGLDMTLLEVDEAANAISEQVDQEANIIFGAAFDPSLDGIIRVSVVATGMDGASIKAIEPQADRRPQGQPVARAPEQVRQPEAPVQPAYQAAPVAASYQLAADQSVPTAAAMAPEPVETPVVAEEEQGDLYSEAQPALAA
jgi:cell division protein FtsZ